MKYNLYEMEIVVIIVSFLGFTVENIWLALTKGYINNRNMNLPFLLGYGLAMAAVYFLFGIPSEMILMTKVKVRASRAMKILLYFLCVMFCVSVGEIVIGTVTEKLCRIEYWNYSGLPLHITKYTSIPTSAGFAGMITLFMEKIFPPLMERLSNMNENVLHVIVLVLLTALLIDFIYCYGKMVKTHNFYHIWEVAVRKLLVPDAANIPKTI